MSSPLITILTPSYNRAGMIETAVQSVLSQNDREVEHIIIDGGSTDGTLGVLGKYPHLRVVSEPDGGMYDALNKGLDLAVGEIIGFLNSDDYYAPETFAQIKTLFTKENIDAAAGCACVVQKAGDSPQEPVILFPGKGDDLIRHTIMEAPVMNAYFFSRRVFERIGRFDTRYKIAADRDFMLRFALAGFNTAFVDRPVYYYLKHPGSLTFDYSDDKFESIVDEHLVLSRSYLAERSNFPVRLAESLIEMRTRETIRACAHSLRRGEFGKARHYLHEGFRDQPLWGFRFLKHAVTHPIRRKLGQPYQSP